MGQHLASYPGGGSLHPETRSALPGPVLWGRSRLEPSDFNVSPCFSVSVHDYQLSLLLSGGRLLATSFQQTSGHHVSSSAGPFVDIADMLFQTRHVHLYLF